MRIFSFGSLINARQRSLGTPRNILVLQNHVLWWDIDGRLWGWKRSSGDEWSRLSPLWRDDRTPERLFLEKLRSWGQLVQLRIYWNNPQKSCDAVAIAPQHGIFPLTFPWTDDEPSAQRTAQVFRHDGGLNLFMRSSARKVIPLHSAASALCSLDFCFGLDALGQLTALIGDADGEVAEPLPIAVPCGRRVVDFVYYTNNKNRYFQHVLFEDGSLGLLPHDHSQLCIHHVTIGSGLDSPITELINYIQCKTRISILVRTQSDR